MRHMTARKNVFQGFRLFQKRPHFFRFTTMQFILTRVKKIGHQRVEFFTDVG